MPRIFWSGKLTWPMALLVNSNNILAGLAGKLGRAGEMTDRVKRGYDAAFSDHVLRYDELGLKFQLRAARAQLEEVDLRGKTVLDIGCGTGVIARLALEQGASHATCGDIAPFMLDIARRRAAELAIGPDRMSFRELDAQSLPFPDASFDVVVTGMTLGLIPDQKKAVAEMVRVCRPGGLVCAGAHGPEHYWEAVDASFRAVPKRYVLGYRMEYWPQSEKVLRKLMSLFGLEGLWFKRVIWRNRFPSGGEAFDFFAAISASFWYGKFPTRAVGPTADKTRRYFLKNGIDEVTDDVILGYGQKPRP